MSRFRSPAWQGAGAWARALVPLLGALVFFAGTVFCFVLTLPTSDGESGGQARVAAPTSTPPGAGGTPTAAPGAPAAGLLEDGPLPEGPFSEVFPYGAPSYAGSVEQFRTPVPGVGSRPGPTSGSSSTERTSSMAAQQSGTGPSTSAGRSPAPGVAPGRTTTGPLGPPSTPSVTPSPLVTGPPPVTRPPPVTDPPVTGPPVTTPPPVTEPPVTTPPPPETTPLLPTA